MNLIIIFSYVREVLIVWLVSFTAYQYSLDYLTPDSVFFFFKQSYASSTYW